MAEEQSSGIDVMRRRIERASRRPPPAPRTRDDDATPALRSAPEAPTAQPQATAPPAAAVGEGGGDAAALTRAATTRRRGPARLRLAPDLPPVNLAIRVRKPLDDHLADLIHALRREGVRTSKVELVEMLLWEQTGEGAEAVRARLGAFRAAAPRGPGAAI